MRLKSGREMRARARADLLGAGPKRPPARLGPGAVYKGRRGVNRPVGGFVYSVVVLL